MIIHLEGAYRCVKDCKKKIFVLIYYTQQIVAIKLDCRFVPESDAKHHLRFDRSFEIIMPGFADKGAGHVTH